MRFASTAGLVAFVASTVVDANISPLDLDGSVWEGLSSLNQRRAFTPQLRNRPVKRQSGWSPPSDLATPLKEVWDHCLKTYSDGNLFGFKNYGMDQLMAAEGSLNMCVRWESSEPVTAAQRTQVAAAINAQYQKWFKWLYGFDNFPFTDIPVKVVGWAVKDASLLQGDTSDIDVYTDKDGEGIPECAPACGRFFHQNKDYSGCKGGAARHYDQSVWLTDGLGGGTGGDWGQRIGREYFMNALNSENIHILLHEMGHTFGLDDFYDWTPTGVSSFVMLAGSAAQITDFDGWMVRNWWYELSRNRNWQSGASTGGNTGGSTGTSTSGGSVSTPTTPTQTQPAPVSSSPPQSTVAASSQPPKVPTTAVRPTRVTKSISPVRTTSAGGNPVINVPSQTSAASSNSGGNGATAARWQQCGGAGWTGPSQCASGFTCTKHNDWYSQCL